MLDLLLSSLRTLRAHALRFTLTSLGIVWGSFMLTHLMANMEGTNAHFIRELEEAGPKIVLVWPGAVLKNRVGQRGAREVELDNDDIGRLESLGSIEAVAPDLSIWNEIVRAGGRTKLFTVNGISHQSASIRNLRPREGRFLTPLDVERGSRVAYLGAEVKKRLFGHEPAIGRRVQIQSISFRVIGVNEAKEDQMIGINGWDDWVVFVPYTTAQRWLLKTDEISELVFAPVTREGSWESMRHVREILSNHHDFPHDLDTAVNFFNVYDVLQIVHTLFFGLRIFMVSAGVITLMVGAVGVMNIMLVVVGERTHEIGLRKAVGAPSRAIFVQFLAEAGAVCALSGLVGTGLGVLFTWIVKMQMPPDSPLASTPILDPLPIAVTTAALVVVGMLAGVVPAVRAARIPPAEALRAT